MFGIAPERDEDGIVPRNSHGLARDCFETAAPAFLEAVENLLVTSTVFNPAFRCRLLYGFVRATVARPERRRSPFLRFQSVVNGGPRVPKKGLSSEHNAVRELGFAPSRNREKQ